MRNSPDDYALRGSTPIGVDREGTWGGCLFHAKVFADTSKKNKLTVSTLFFIQFLPPNEETARHKTQKQS